jgi:ASCH domain-containing protein
VNLDQLVALPILSIRQPWAAYVVSGYKTIELRTWPTDYRGWLWIHAGRTPDLDAMDVFQLSPERFRYGGLVGIAHLAACEPIETPTEWYTLRNEHRSPGAFARGVHGWRFDDAIALPDKIDLRGQLKLFDLDPPTRERIREQLEESPLYCDFVEMIDLVSPFAV